ncbi:MAG: dTDP-4-dehydrorhamnose 3,5-epimerase [Bacteroides sp.]|nr:dTDP-4-dehydrorhamnose 3,5-epimerase [Bacteroides sp.]
MEIIDTGFEGLLVVKPRVFTDSRGYFFESFSLRDFERCAGRGVDFVQDNESCSQRGVIRGLHFQRPPYTQAKLVRCVSGRVIDVALDIRRSSPTYGQHFSIELSGENKLALFIPRGFAHGFAVVSEEAVFQYKCDNYYHPESEGGISIFSPSLDIDWGIEPGKAILSPKDLNYPSLNDFNTPFE